MSDTTTEVVAQRVYEQVMEELLGMEGDDHDLFCRSLTVMTVVTARVVEVLLGSLPPEREKDVFRDFVLQLAETVQDIRLAKSMLDRQN